MYMYVKRDRERYLSCKQAREGWRAGYESNGAPSTSLIAEEERERERMRMRRERERIQRGGRERERERERERIQIERYIPLKSTIRCEMN